MSAYDRENLLADLLNVISSRPAGPKSGEPLGNSANMALWTEDKVSSLYTGLSTAYRLLYPELEDLRTFARFVLCICMQESTGDHALNVGSPLDLASWAGQGVLQVTAASVVKDFRDWGGRLGPLDPKKAHALDLGDPCTCILLWAWYSRACCLAGISIAEWVHRDEWGKVTGRVAKVYGNAMYAWLAGPGKDFRVSASDHLTHYFARISDYWTSAGFGTAAECEAIVNTKIAWGRGPLYCKPV